MRAAELYEIARRRALQRIRDFLRSEVERRTRQHNQNATGCNPMCPSTSTSCPGTSQRSSLPLASTSNNNHCAHVHVPIASPLRAAPAAVRVDPSAASLLPAEHSSCSSTPNATLQPPPAPGLTPASPSRRSRSSQSARSDGDDERAERARSPSPATCSMMEATGSEPAVATSSGRLPRSRNASGKHSKSLVASSHSDGA